MSDIKEKKSSVYTEYFKIGFRKSIEYKSYIISALTTPVFMGVFFYFIWSYIYEVKSAGVANFQIGGFTFEEMMVYLIIGLLINSIRSSEISESIAQTIKSGDIAIYLCRPVNFVKSLLADGIGTKIIPLLTFTGLLIGMTYLFNLPYPSGTIFIIFLVYAFFMLLFDIILYVIIGGLSFWFVEIWGIRASIEQVLWILSGRVLPLSLFPVWFLDFIKFTPFFYLEYTFARLYLGKIGVMEAFSALGVFIFWIIMLSLLMRFIYKKGFAKMEAFGG